MMAFWNKSNQNNPQLNNQNRKLDKGEEEDGEERIDGILDKSNHNNVTNYSSL